MREVRLLRFTAQIVSPAPRDGDPIPFLEGQPSHASHKNGGYQVKSMPNLGSTTTVGLPPHAGRESIDNNTLRWMDDEEEAI